MEIKKYLLILAIFLCLNPVFLVMFSGLTPETATDQEKVAIGIYFICWMIFGFYKFVYQRLKLKPKVKVRTMEELIDDAWKEHRNEKNE